VPHAATAGMAGAVSASRQQDDTCVGAMPAVNLAACHPCKLGRAADSTHTRPMLRPNTFAGQRWRRCHFWHVMQHIVIISGQVAIPEDGNTVPVVCRISARFAINPHFHIDLSRSWRRLPHCTTTARPELGCSEVWTGTRAIHGRPFSFRDGLP